VRWQAATIERTERRTPRVTSLWLRAELGPHQAGQHLDVRLTAPDGYAAQRSYSIASAPGAALIEVAIERLDDGEVSPYFHDVAQAGDSIEVRGPIGGHFVWRAGDGGPLLLIAGGSGIVPLMAMARHRAIAAPETRTLLVVSARTWDEIVFRAELLEGAARDLRLQLVLSTTREPRRRPQDHEQRLDDVLLARVLADWGHTPRHVYVCGATRFVEAVTGGLVRCGIPSPAVRTERYGGAR
jgi:ferredoxin-NADP reductase